MEILWPALGIGVIVSFVFFVFAQHLRRILRQQSWMIRRLAERVEDLEGVGDPEFRRRLNESAPVPLEQVFNFSFRLSDRFWRETLRTTDENLKFIRSFGSFLGSVKLERWRSHTVATITEVLPESKTAGWQTRSLDFYPDPAKRNDLLTLWELPLARLEGSSNRPPSLELVLRRDSVELLGHLSTFASDDEHRDESNSGEVVFFRVPLDRAQLAEFRSCDPRRDANTGHGNPGAHEISTNGSSWQAFYSHQDENLGLEWQLWVRDLSKKAEWERWKILEAYSVPLSEDEK